MSNFFVEGFPNKVHTGEFIPRPIVPEYALAK
jgi:hypothetical protein